MEAQIRSGVRPRRRFRLHCFNWLEARIRVRPQPKIPHAGSGDLMAKLEPRSEASNPASGVAGGLVDETGRGSRILQIIITGFGFECRLSRGCQSWLATAEHTLTIFEQREWLYQRQESLPETMDFQRSSWPHWVRSRLISTTIELVLTNLF